MANDATIIRRVLILVQEPSKKHLLAIVEAKMAVTEEEATKNLSEEEVEDLRETFRTFDKVRTEPRTRETARESSTYRRHIYDDQNNSLHRNIGHP